MSENVKILFLSSLEKCFLDEKIESKTETTEFYVFRNQKLAFQMAMYYSGDPGASAKRSSLILTGETAKYVTVRQVTNVPSIYPVYPEKFAGTHLRSAPGLYPDLIEPLQYRDTVLIPNKMLYSLWFELKLPESFAAGEYTLGVTLEKKDGGIYATGAVKFHVSERELPPQKTLHTEWFYTDCIAEYYNVEVFSDKHWDFIGNYLKTAADNGINLILTPVFTPALDTYVGGERLTTQLVDIEVTSKGVYGFGWEKLERWVDLCLSHGIKRFEIPHFFTQWGARHAPKIVGTVNGKTEKLFGWETDFNDEAYIEFLSQFIPSLLKFFKARGLDKNCFFHISDEPKIEHLDTYMECRKIIEPLLDGQIIIDAMSDYEFYESGALKTPVPAVEKVEPFIRNKVEDLWIYYCGGGSNDTTNRSMSMPLGRTRILGVQMYLYDIKGFLHWGFNYYNNRWSYDRINPFLETGGNFFSPSGDAYLVYPGQNGKPLDSLRLNAIREAMEDIRILKLCEAVKGREFTENLVRETAGGTLTFTDYPTDGKFFTELMKKVSLIVEEI